MSAIQAKDRLILALDVKDIPAARAVVNELDGVVEFFKVGLTLQLAEGVEDFIRELIKSGIFATINQLIDADTAAIRALNAKVAADPRVEHAMVPLSDGLTLARKR